MKSVCGREYQTKLKQLLHEFYSRLFKKSETHFIFHSSFFILHFDYLFFFSHFNAAMIFASFSKVSKSSPPGSSRSGGTTVL
jgi:hypothetical protein